MEVSRFDLILNGVKLLYVNGHSYRLYDDFVSALSPKQRQDFVHSYPSLDARQKTVQELYDRVVDLFGHGSLPSDLETRIEGEDSVRVICEVVMKYIFTAERLPA